MVVLSFYDCMKHQTSILESLIEAQRLGGCINYERCSWIMIDQLQEQNEKGLDQQYIYPWWCFLSISWLVTWWCFHHRAWWRLYLNNVRQTATQAAVTGKTTIQMTTQWTFKTDHLYSEVNNCIISSKSNSYCYSTSLLELSLMDMGNPWPGPQYWRWQKIDSIYLHGLSARVDSLL